MQQINKEIALQYDFFLELFREKKMVDSNIIYLKPKQNKLDWISG